MPGPTRAASSYRRARGRRRWWPTRACSLGRRVRCDRCETNASRRDVSGRHSAQGKHDASRRGVSGRHSAQGKHSARVAKSERHTVSSYRRLPTVRAQRHFCGAVTPGYRARAVAGPAHTWRAQGAYAQVADRRRPHRRGRTNAARVEHRPGEDEEDTALDDPDRQGEQ